MPVAEFEPTIPASKRPHTHALDRAATGIGCRKWKNKNSMTPLEIEPATFRLVTQWNKYVVRLKKI
jgi:hypothetical protein